MRKIARNKSSCPSPRLGFLRMTRGYLEVAKVFLRRWSSLARSLSAWFRQILATGKPFLQLYAIDGASYDTTDFTYTSKRSWPSFSADLNSFKHTISEAISAGQPMTFLKFGDGDYYFLNGIPTGSARPGHRAISQELSEESLETYRRNSRMADRYMCEIGVANRRMFRQVFPDISIDYPAEFVYGLLANRWLTSQFRDSIGLIGGEHKLRLIEKLMEFPEYQEYLGLEKFEDYILIPERFAADDLRTTLIALENQIQNSSSSLFLMGVGHVKSGIIPHLPKFRGAVYLDVGSGIDALAGIINPSRPYMSNWTNFRLKSGFDYSSVDLLDYSWDDRVREIV